MSSTVGGRTGAEAVTVFAPRDVPLGGPRAMTVRRTLPSRERTLIGAWCFVDHYGPDDVGTTGGMDLPPHPHTGLATVSWLFTGDIEHRDSAGHTQRVRPGELSLMTAGRGISHSEYTGADTTVLHGAQLWIALPDASRGTAPAYDHHRPEPVTGEGWQVRVFLGELLGAASPVRTHTPLLGAELRLQPGARLDVPVEASYELGVLVDAGAVQLDGRPVAAGELAQLDAGRARLSLESAQGARLLLLGGPPFGEEIVMWWNFVGRSHEEVAGFRDDWERLLATGPGNADDRFTLPPADPKPPLHAPPMPHVRLRSRR